MYWIIAYHTKSTRKSPWAIYEFDRDYIPRELEVVFPTYIYDEISYMTVLQSDNQETALERGKKLIEATFC